MRGSAKAAAVGIAAVICLSAGCGDRPESGADHPQGADEPAVSSVVAIVAAGEREPCWDGAAIDSAIDRGASGALLLCPGSGSLEPAAQARAWSETVAAAQLPAVLWPKAAADATGAGSHGRFGQIGIARGNPPERPEDADVDRPGGAGLLLVPAAPADDGPPMGEIRMIWTPLLVSPGGRTEIVTGGQMRRLTVALGDLVIAEVTPTTITIIHIKPKGGSTVLLSIERD